jgi:hypothetical protein
MKKPRWGIDHTRRRIEMRSNRVLSLGLLALPMMIAAVMCSGQNKALSQAAKDGEVIFKIGKEDGSDKEFINYGWTGIEEYIFRVGVDTDDKFPAELHLRGAYSSYGVVTLKIAFSAKQSYDKVILRLVRGGDETSVVTVDKQQPCQVTSSMLGSGEGFRAGSYELDIGGLQKGEHTLMFTLLADGKGNGAYQWDALELFGIAGK